MIELFTSYYPFLSFIPFSSSFNFFLFSFFLKGRGLRDRERFRGRKGGRSGVNERRVCQKRRLVDLGVWRLSEMDECVAEATSKRVCLGGCACALFLLS
jgi:hypothetical protein